MIRSSQPHEEEPHSDRRSRVPGLWLYTRSLPFTASFGILKEKTEELEKAEASLALLCDSYPGEHLRTTRNTSSGNLA
jgi:hypothetical protein